MIFYRPKIFFRKNIINVFPIFISPRQITWVNFKNFSPLSYAFFATIIFYKRVCRGVSSLCKTTGPATIFGGIIAIIIYSIYRMSHRLFSHILVEVFKLLPSFTHLNSATAVVFIFFVFYVLTSLPHASPRSVFSRMSKPVGSVFNRTLLFLKASTRSAFTCFNIAKKNNLFCFFSARANTLYVQIPFSSTVYFNNFPSIKFGSNYIHLKTDNTLLWRGQKNVI